MLLVGERDGQKADAGSESSLGGTDASGAARAFLEEQCQQAPQTPSSTIQVARYEQAAGLQSLGRIVVDREGMAAEFLAHLSTEGRKDSRHGVANRSI